MIPSTPAADRKELGDGGKRRRRRVKKKVRKEFKDEDGFTVVKEEVVSCSESGEDAEEEVKSKVPRRRVKVTIRQNILNAHRPPLS